MTLAEKNERTGAAPAAPPELAALGQVINLGRLSQRLKDAAAYLRRRADRIPHKRNRYLLLAAPVGEAAQLLDLALASGPPVPAGTPAPLPIADLDALGRTLRQRREQLLLTRAMLAARTHVASRTIQNVEMALHRPRAAILRRLIRALYPEARDDSAG